MSRLRHLARSLSSGYIQITANTIFTAVSVPLALHYLPTKEFGLWALVTQVVGYFLLVELGMTPAMVRVLIDHKDQPAEGGYGSVVRTATAVLATQGLLVALLSWLLGYWLPNLMDVPPAYQTTFRHLVLGYGVLTGLLFPHRILTGMLTAFQRYDVVNYASTASLFVNLAVLWFGLAQGWKTYSLLVSSAAGMLTNACFQLATVQSLKLRAPRHARGRVDFKVFREIFWFGGDLFLISIAMQLINASQIIVVSRMLGLEAAAVWTVATKIFTLAQQFVWRLWDFSASAISEMHVRGERERLTKRFHDIYVCTASLAVFAGIGVSVCNESLLALWTRHRISWDGANDVLMALLFTISSTTRLYIGLISTLKTVQALRYVYFLEAIFFLALAVVGARWIGFPGVIGAAIVMNVLWTGIYGTRRVAKEFKISPVQIAGEWLAPAARLALMLGLVAMLSWWLVRGLSAPMRLAINVGVVAFAGAFLFWRFGLTPQLRNEFQGFLSRFRNRFPFTREAAAPAD